MAMLKCPTVHKTGNITKLVECSVDVIVIWNYCLRIVIEKIQSALVNVTLIGLRESVRTEWKSSEALMRTLVILNKTGLNSYDVHYMKWSVDMKQRPLRPESTVLVCCLQMHYNPPKRGLLFFANCHNW